MAGVACYLVAVACAYVREATLASALIVAAVEALCLAVWLFRGHDDGFGEDDDVLEPDPPVDWAEFDRLRRGGGGAGAGRAGRGVGPARRVFLSRARGGPARGGGGPGAGRR